MIVIPNDFGLRFTGTDNSASEETGGKTASPGFPCASAGHPMRSASGVQPTDCLKSRAVAILVGNMTFSEMVRMN